MRKGEVRECEYVIEREVERGRERERERERERDTQREGESGLNEAKTELDKLVFSCILWISCEQEKISKADWLDQGATPWVRMSF